MRWLGRGLVVSLLLAGCIKDPSEGLVTSLPPQPSFTVAPDQSSASRAPSSGSVGIATPVPSSPVVSPPSASGQSGAPTRVSLSQITLDPTVTNPVPPTDPPMPKLTPPKQERTAASAGKFAEWYALITEISLQTGSIDLMRTFSSPDCTECSRAMSLTSKAISDGWHYRNVRTWAVVIDTEAIEPGRYRVVVFTGGGPGVVVGRDDRVVSNVPKYTARVGYDIGWFEGLWRVNDVYAVAR